MKEFSISEKKNQYTLQNISITVFPPWAQAFIDSNNCSVFSETSMNWLWLHYESVGWKNTKINPDIMVCW
jgi:hypothetical protein